MTSHVTHLSVNSIGDELDVEQVWGGGQATDTHASELPIPAPETTTNGNSQATKEARHPLLVPSPVRSTNNGASNGNGLIEGMPTRPSLQRALEGSFGPDGLGDFSGFGKRSRQNTGVAGDWEGESMSSEFGGSSVGTSELEEGREVVGGVEVIVHEVRPKDSLEGVALKYNVPLTTLRRINKLWLSDPIHLRRTLYIPVPKKPTRPSISHTISSPTITASPTLLFRDEEVPALSCLPTNDSISTIRPGERKIVPASELSFFPPPKQSTALAPRHIDIPPRRHARTNTISFLPATASASLNASPSGSPRPHTLLDIFKSLPDVSAIGRRSLDSLSLGSSAREEGEEAAVQAVELKELEVDTRTGRRLNEQLKPSAGMFIREGGGGGKLQMEEEDEWL